jgi:hypothetical protein
MTSVPGKVRPSTGAALRPWPPALRSWRTAVGLTAVASGATMIAGAFLPWVAEFGGLIPVVGVRGSNGRMLAAAGILIVAAGLYHLLRGGSLSRWLVGIGGAVALAFSGDLLVRLSASIRSLSGGDGMVAARGGPGLWVIGAGSLLAFGTLFLPSSAQATLRRHDGSGGIVSWAADRESRGPRRWIQVGLGLAWLLDAALQYQPFMFGRGFASQIISPTSMGNPALLGDPVMSAARAIAEHPFAWNAAFATIQLALAAGLLWRPAVRAALAGSVVWALGVWWLGEGLGGVFTGMASPLSGAPGAALIYAFIAVLCWPARPDQERGTSVADGSPVGGRWARLAWLALWGGLAYLAVLPVNRAPGSVHDAVAGLSAGEPHWIGALDRAVAAAAGSHGAMISVAMAVVFVLVGAGALVSRTTRPALILGIAAALVIWVAGENFGGILTGQGTDPNTGPLLILLAAAFWPRAAVSGLRRSGSPGAEAGSGNRSRRELVSRRTGRGPG